MLGILANNSWSNAGWSDRPEVNLLYSQVFLNYKFGKTGWYLTTAPIITANWLAPSAGGVGTVPLGIAVGKLVHAGRLPLNCNISDYEYATAQAGGPSRTVRV